MYVIIEENDPPPVIRRLATGLRPIFVYELLSFMLYIYVVVV